jgi:hypothetical protein
MAIEDVDTVKQGSTSNSVSSNKYYKSLNTPTATDAGVYKGIGLPIDTNIDTNRDGTRRYSADRWSGPLWRKQPALPDPADAAIRSENATPALIRKRSLVRVQAGPRQKNDVLQVKTRNERRPRSISGAFVQQRACGRYLRASSRARTALCCISGSTWE